MVSYAKNFKLKKWKEELEEKKELLKTYKDQEKKMLSGAAQSYSLGTRSVTKYSADLNTVRNNIKDLEEEIKELEYKINGIALRKRMSFVPRDR